MKNIFYALLSFLVVISLNQGCVDNDASVYLNEHKLPGLPDIPFNYSRLDGDPKFSDLSGKIALEVTDHGATLGRVLYYDKKLSINNTVSCASCHQQKFGFADNVALSSGFDGKKTLRNSHSICNTASKSSFFWDGREKSLQNLVLQPIRDHIEMGLDNTASMVNRIKDTEYYKPLFTNAFGDSQITAERIASALRQFVHSIVSTQAPVEKIVETGWGQIPEIPAGFTPEQSLGANLFFGKAMCFSCHSPSSRHPVFFADIGLETEFSGKDAGRGQFVNGKDGEFIVPTLINIALTAPYMHDGRFTSLEEVIEHYNSGIKNSPNLHWNLFDFSNNKPIKLNLDTQEKKALVAFLQTFTDQHMISDSKYSDPFVK